MKKMSATNSENSIGSSRFIPNWVKSKLDNSGFDPSALSPPTHDGEFFYIKFPRPEKVEVKEKPKHFGPINESVTVKEKIFANHTTSCKKFIPTIQESTPIIKPKITKPMGIDDEFNDDGSACGASVVAVAQQMISGKYKLPVRGFTTDDANEKPSTNYLRQRRNSKSLPTSPLISPETSPRTRRKNTTAFALQNRYKSGSIAANDISLNESDENLEKKSGSSWILSGLFSSSKENVLATIKNQQNSLAAEEHTNSLISKTNRDESAGMNHKTNVNVHVEVKSADTNAAQVPDRKMYLKKRSEIRQLNFMSPVSM